MDDHEQAVEETDRPAPQAAEVPQDTSAPHADVPATTQSAGLETEQPVDVESLVASLESVTVERDSHLDDLQRITAEFANFRRQSTKRQSDTVQHAASRLAEKLIPVLDACEAAIGQGAADVGPIHTALLDVLQREGLEIVQPTGEAFDPEKHEAVSHEPGEGEPVVAEVMRSGYSWNGRVLRPAMVRVAG